MTASMSHKGDCRDSAPRESFFNSVKNERVHGTRYEARADADADLFEYIAVFYNRRRSACRGKSARPFPPICCRCNCWFQPRFSFGVAS